MRTRTAPIALFAFVVGLLLCAPTLALAEGESLSRMEAMEGRLLALEDRLASSEATVAAQRDLLKGANVSGGALGQAEGGRFWDRVVIGGHMAASYGYNFNNPDSDARFTSQPFNQFNLTHNSFDLDAIKLEMGLPTNGPGTAGFQFDLLYGENNHILCGDENRIIVDVTDPDGSVTGGLEGALLGASGDESIAFSNVEASDQNVCIQQAYMSYDMNGTVFDFGKWETLLGYEVLDSVDNHHIQHGILFTWAIPLTHTGLRVSGNFTEEISYALGVVNGFNNVMDSGDNKGLVGQLAFSDGPLFTSLSGFYGSEEFRASTTHGGQVGINDDNVLILDFILSYMLNDNTEAWVNVDWATLDREFVGPPPAGPADLSSLFFEDAGRSDPQWWGVAAGLACDINEKLGLAGRAEYFRDDNGARILGLSPGEDQTDYYTLTGTLSYHLTDRLMARAEYRYDWYDSDPSDDESIPTHRASNFKDHNSVGMVEVSYSFD